MFRPLAILATLAFAASCTSVNAQGHGRSSNHGGHHGGSHHSHSHQNQYRSYGGFSYGGFNSGGLGYGSLGFGSSNYGGYRYGGLNSSGYRYGGYGSSYPLTLFGLSFGTTPYGYDYAGYPDPYFTYPYSIDPWSRGSFRAPDLLDDPYFYDRVPSANRYSARRYPAPYVLEPVAPAMRYDSTGQFRSADQYNSYTESGQAFATPEAIALPAESLQSACDRLLLGLASYGGGDAWIEYLAPDRIVDLVEQGNRTELSELMARYDGVSQNRELQVVAKIDGFSETQRLLRHSLSQPIQATVPANAEPASTEQLSTEQLNAEQLNAEQPSAEPAIEDLPAPQPEPILESPANGPAEI